MDVRKFTAGYLTFRFTYYFMGKAYLGSAADRTCACA